MTSNGWFQISLFFGAVLLVTKPLGIFSVACIRAQVHVARPGSSSGRETGLSRLRALMKPKEMRWTEYGIAMLTFSGVSLLFLYLSSASSSGFPGIRSICPM